MGFKSLHWIATAEKHERDGRLTDALDCYAAALAAAEPRDIESRAIALRRQASIHRRRQEFDRALALVRASYETAMEGDAPGLAAEALNCKAWIHIDRCEWTDAERELDRALSLGGASELTGHVEQNLGVIANIRGNYDEARRRYLRSLRAFDRARNELGCARAYHNLGMLSADREQWRDAEAYFDAALERAVHLGDVALRATTLLNRTEVDVACRRFERALASAEEALTTFSQLGNALSKADAYRWLGVVYREQGDVGLAENRFHSAIALARSVGAKLPEAEATRELAILYVNQERNQDALRLLNTSRKLFGALGASADDHKVASNIAKLERIYIEVVARWGRSIEAADTYTFGHSGRVAAYAMTVAKALRLEEADLMTVQVGAYLHDLGKLLVPHEILRKPGKLDSAEYDIIKQHPVWGTEILAGIDFPWPIMPIIRSHHERLDGTGYPDGLAGDAVPFHSQIVAIADVFDAMTSDRNYSKAMPPTQAVNRIRELAHHWRPEVLAAFLATESVLVSLALTNDAHIREVKPSQGLAMIA